MMFVLSLIYIGFLIMLASAAQSGLSTQTLVVAFVLLNALCIPIIIWKLNPKPPRQNTEQSAKSNK